MEIELRDHLTEYTREEEHEQDELDGDPSALRRTDVNHGLAFSNGLSGAEYASLMNGLDPTLRPPIEQPEELTQSQRLARDLDNDNQPAMQSIRRELLELSNRIEALERAGVDTSGLQLPPSFKTPQSLPALNTAAPSPSNFRLAETPATTTKHDTARARGRKVELSRAVRKTMLEMMGLASTSVELPPFDPQNPHPNSGIDGRRQWRWDWSKTIHASQHNAGFVDAIYDTVLAKRDGSERLFHDVPIEDWAALRNGIESAYVNLRREWDSRQTDDKKLRKIATQKRNRRRGLKEEKVKRRKQAWDQLKTSPSVNSQLAEFGITSTDYAERALDIRCMSSEESDCDDETTIATPLSGSNITLDPSLASTSAVSTPKPAGPFTSTKTFYVRPPVWRAEPLGKLYNHLDSLKPPERAYRRVSAEPRADGVPPVGVSDDLLDPIWSINRPAVPPSKKRGRPPKRKADDISREDSFVST